MRHEPHRSRESVRRLYTINIAKRKRNRLSGEWNDANDAVPSSPHPTCWEHQIRDENDLERHVDYIHATPVKHGLVPCVKDWAYSSFHRYVDSGWLSADWAGTVPDAGGYGE